MNYTIFWAGNDRRKTFLPEKFRMKQWPWKKCTCPLEESVWTRSQSRWGIKTSLAISPPCANAISASMSKVWC